MKKVISVLILSIALSFTSTAQTNINLYDYQDELRSLVKDIENNGNVLSFDNEDEVKNTLKVLEDIYEKWNNTFEANFSDSIDSEELEKYEELYKFDEDQPYIDFENLLEFNSLRKRGNLEEDSWLEANGDNIENVSCPTDDYLIQDDTEQVIFNDKSQIMINGKLIDYSVSVNGDTFKEKCKFALRKITWFPTNVPDRKIKAIASLQGGIWWGGSLNAKTKSYKKRGNRYYKSRQPIYAAFDGTSKVRPQKNCDVTFPVELREKFENRKKVKVIYREWGEQVKAIPSDGTTFDIITYHNRLTLTPWRIKL